MKKQQKTYMLLAAVLFIWGVIGVQIYLRINPVEPELQATVANVFFEKKRVVENTSYQLKKEYRDPFFGKFPVKKKKKKPKIVKKEVQKNFPNVVYNGLIKGVKDNTYVLTINGKQQILKKGTVVDGIKIVKASSDEVTLLFESQQKVFEKQ